MGDKLPERFDVVILGTGLPECIIAAACARSGLSVLQVDRNDYYGDLWASFNLRTIQDWITKNGGSCSEVQVNHESFLNDGEKFLAATCRSFVENIHQQRFKKQPEIWPNKGYVYLCFSHVDNPQESDASVALHLQDIDLQWRKFSLDLLPKILLSRGNMVKLLCDSGVAKYCEFKCVNRLLSCSSENGSNSLEVVPCSRGEIFQSEAISSVFLIILLDVKSKRATNVIFRVQDKRRVMRFLQKCIEWRKNPNETEGWKGLEAVCQFLESVGRFGDSPFLWTLYGSGELPQCFARLCAVFGGIYCLNRSVDGFVVAGERVVATVIGGQRIECNHVIANRAYLPEHYLNTSLQTRLNRVILISDRSILPDFDKEHISVLNLSSLESDALPYLLEIGYEGGISPKGKYAIHITGQSDNSAQVVLNPIVDRFFSVTENEEMKSHILWSLYFDLALPSVNVHNLPKNMRVVPCVDKNLNYSKIIFEVEEIFEELWPDRDFLPPSLTEEEGRESDADMISSEAEQEATVAESIPE
uniref:Rab proteins geranylgeranyltransferase component A n=1 Tax=Setaria digitata TaxID=48799 RepID=A0A915Q589_9BILA